MMKKVTSKLIAIVLTLAMALGCASTAFADEAPKIDETQTGSITVVKYDSSKVTVNDDGNIVPKEGLQDNETILVNDAVFSAYKIIDYDDGEYTVNADFAEAEINLEKVVGATSSDPNTSYGSTDELEAIIAGLQSYIKNHANQITVAASGMTGKNTDGTEGLEGTAKLSGLEVGVYLVQETVVPTSGATGYTVSSQAFLVSIPEWNQDARDGYGAWNYNVTAYPKDEKITVDKKMGEGNNKTTSDSYSIGDTIPYTVTATIPNYGYTLGNQTKTVTTELLEKGQYDKYNALKVEFTDILSKGLTLDMDRIDKLTIIIPKADSEGKDVRLNGAFKDENNENKLKEFDDKGNVIGEYDFLVKAEKTRIKKEIEGENGGVQEVEVDVTKMTVEISWDALDRYQGKQIQLTYSARLNEDAFIKDANTNDVTYKFSHDPQKSAEEPHTEITPPDTETYTYQMNLTKLLNNEKPEDVKDVDKNGTDVSGVTFQLYVEGSTTPLYVKKTSDGVYTICTEPTETEIEEKTVQQEIHPTAKGSLSVKGFKAGTYELEETKSVSGYTLLTKPITIVVEENTDAEGKVINGTVNAYIKGATGEENVSLVTSDATDGTNAENGIFKITVNNVKKQFNLPQTGGAGLWMFTIAGGILMALAIIFFHTLRTKKKKDN